MTKPIDHTDASLSRIAIVLAAGLLLTLSGAQLTDAGTLRNDVVGPPVDRNSRSLELRANPQQANPIAYGARLAAEESKPEGAKKGNDKDSDSLLMPESSAPPLSPAQQYCSNIVDVTSAAQIAQQTRNLEKARKEIDDRITLLNAKAEVLQRWMKLREDFTARATDSLVQIYSKMKADSAAAQLAAMEELTSAAIISKLAPKVASPIMAEMTVEKAARLSAVIAGSGDLAIQPERKVNDQH